MHGGVAAARNRARTRVTSRWAPLICWGCWRGSVGRGIQRRAGGDHFPLCYYNAAGRHSPDSYVCAQSGVAAVDLAARHPHTYFQGSGTDRGSSECIGSPIRIQSRPACRPNVAPGRRLRGRSSSQRERCEIVPALPKRCPPYIEFMLFTDTGACVRDYMHCVNTRRALQAHHIRNVNIPDASIPEKQD